MFRLQSVQGKNRLQNVHTKSSSYQMFRIQNVRLRDRCYELWLRNVRYKMSKLRHVWQPLVSIGTKLTKNGINS